MSKKDEKRPKKDNPKPPPPTKEHPAQPIRIIPNIPPPDREWLNEGVERLRNNESFNELGQ